MWTYLYKKFLCTANICLGRPPTHHPTYTIDHRLWLYQQLVAGRGEGGQDLHVCRICESRYVRLFRISALHPTKSNQNQQRERINDEDARTRLRLTVVQLEAAQHEEQAQKVEGVERVGEEPELPWLCFVFRVFGGGEWWGRESHLST